MNYRWDARKASSNVRKHGVEFADAVSVFEDDLALTIPGDYPDDEWLVTLGTDAFGRLLVVVYMYRGEDSIRLISARKATANGANNMRKRHERRIPFQEGTTRGNQPAAAGEDPDHDPAG